MTLLVELCAGIQGGNQSRDSDDFKCGIKQIFLVCFGFAIFWPLCEQFALIANESCSVSTATNAVLRVSHVHPEHGRRGRHRCR